MSIKNKKLHIMILIFISIFFVSCKKDKEPEAIKETSTISIETPKNFSGDMEILIGNREEKELFEKIISEYNKKNNVTFKITTSEDPVLTLKSRAEMGKAPDIFIGSLNKSVYSEFINQNYLSEISTALISNNINQKILEKISIDGKFYSIPVSADVNGIIINETLFRKYNYPIPKTWEELLNTFNKIEDSHIYPFIIYNSPTEKSILLPEIILGTEVSNLGEDFFKNISVENSELNSISKKIIQIAEKSDSLSHSFDFEQAINDFASNRAFMMVGSSKDIHKLNFINPNSKWKILSFPSQNNLLDLELSTSVYIFNSSKNADSVNDFAKYFINKNISDFYSNSKKSIPLVNDVAIESPELEYISYFYNEGKFFFSPKFYTTTTEEIMLLETINKIFESQGFNTFRFSS